jgi:hypothetical protein
MNHATNSRALRVGAVCLLAVLALLLLRAPWVSAGAAPGEEGGAEEAGTCGAGPTTTMDQAMAEAMARVREAKGQPGTDAESGYVVLNNRGYNYGPPPGVQLDAHLFEREGAGQRQP